jgi:hypothetical protein
VSEPEKVSTGPDKMPTGASLRRHCRDYHDLDPMSRLEGVDLEQWHARDHDVISTHPPDDLRAVFGKLIWTDEVIDINPPPATDPGKVLAQRYRDLRLDRQSVAQRNGPASLIEQLTIDMIRTADALATLVLNS